MRKIPGQTPALRLTERIDIIQKNCLDIFEIYAGHIVSTMIGMTLICMIVFLNCDWIALFRTFEENINLYATSKR